MQVYMLSSRKTKEPTEVDIFDQEIKEITTLFGNKNENIPADLVEIRPMVFEDNGDEDELIDNTGDMFTKADLL